jgi:preprotein translocase subunit SecA
MKGDIPVQDSDQVQEARAQKRQRLSEQKEESRSLLQGGGAQPQQQKTEEKVMPVKSEKIAGRNDKVTVQYPDGRVLKDVKYKKVEEDIQAGRCIVIEQ